MRKIYITITVLFLIPFFFGQNCVNFEGNYNINNWTSYNTDLHTIQNDVTHGNYLELTDDSGGSWEANSADFGGNWLTRAQNGCLCFDYNVDWSAGNTATIPVKAPKIAVFNSTYRAAFVGNSSNPNIQNDIWRNFCLPIGLSNGTSLPSNFYGTWVVYQGSTLLSGVTAATAWDSLIQNVTGLNLYTDYNSFPGEKVRFDNFCWTCATLPCALTINAIVKAEVCSDRTGSISINPSGGVAPYTITVNGVASQPNLTGLAAGNYGISITDGNGCTATERVTVFNEPCPPNPCCKNTLSLSSAATIPPSYPYNEGTYAVEKYNFTTPSNAPITELKVEVISFEWLDEPEDCKQCQIKSPNLGSILGGINIGGLTIPATVQPYGNGLASVSNNNEVVFSFPNGRNINPGDFLRLVYLLPPEKNLTCCQTKAKVCRKITWKDINCGYCEVYDCSTVDLKNKSELPIGFSLPTITTLYLNSRDIFSNGRAAGF